MKPQHAISSPAQDQDYPGRQADCLAALRPSVADIAGSGEPLLPDGPEMSAPLAILVERVGQAGWSQGETITAIRALGRELQGTSHTMFD